MQLIHLGSYRKKLLTKGQFTDQEIEALINELEHFRKGAAFLASCQAATLEGLPKSTSKSQRERHRSICMTAAKMLQGDITAVRSSESIEWSADRCWSAASHVTPLQA